MFLQTDFFVGAEPVKEYRYKRSYDDNRAKVLILGAGAAGLQAARYFHDNEMDDFIIIEGADFIGGRVHNVPFAGVNVELGANWAQPGDTPIIDQVERVGLKTHVSDWDSMIMLNATGYDVTKFNETDQSWKQIEKATKKMVNIAENIIDNDEPDMSQRTALRLSDWVPKTAIKRAIEWFSFDFEWADIPAVTSLQATALLNATDDILFVTDQRGFMYIFNDIVGFLQEDPYLNHVRLKQTVLSVNQSLGDRVTVTCEDGTVYTGEYALITFSLGVMHEESVEFIPALPYWKIEELYQFTMASFTKIFVKWPSKFWGDEEWIVHVSDRRCGYYPAFLNLEAEGLFPSGTNILVAFLTGEESRRIESQSDDETKAEIETIMRNLYGMSVPNADDILISGWNRNPLHRGAYSNWPVEVSSERFKKMQTRVGRLFFGGEHTDEHYNGYVLGAQLSGEREAKKMMQCLNGACPQPIYLENTAPHTFSRMSNIYLCEVALLVVLVLNAI